MRVIMVGGNETVYFLAKRFSKRGYHVTIVNRDPARSRDLAHSTGAWVVEGEGTDVRILEDAGARSADVFLAMTSHDQDNLVASQLADVYFGISRVIAVVNDPDNEAVFRKLGIRSVFSEAQIIGSVIDRETSFQDITALVPLASGRLRLTEVHIDDESPVLEKTISNMGLTEGALVACIIRGEEIIVPHGSTEIKLDDRLILISAAEHQERNLEKLGIKAEDA